MADDEALTGGGREGLGPASSDAATKRADRLRALEAGLWVTSLAAPQVAFSLRPGPEILVALRARAGRATTAEIAAALNADHRAVAMALDVWAACGMVTATGYGQDGAIVDAVLDERLAGPILDSALAIIAAGPDIPARSCEALRALGGAAAIALGQLLVRQPMRRARFATVVEAANRQAADEANSRQALPEDAAAGGQTSVDALIEAGVVDDFGNLVALSTGGVDMMRWAARIPAGGAELATGTAVGAAVEAESAQVNATIVAAAAAARSRPTAQAHAAAAAELGSRIREVRYGQSLIPLVTECLSHWREAADRDPRRYVMAAANEHVSAILILAARGWREDAAAITQSLIGLAAAHPHDLRSDEASSTLS